MINSKRFILWLVGLLILSGLVGMAAGYFEFEPIVSLVFGVLVGFTYSAISLPFVLKD